MKNTIIALGFALVTALVLTACTVPGLAKETAESGPSTEVIEQQVKLKMEGGDYQMEAETSTVLPSVAPVSKDTSLDTLLTELNGTTIAEEDFSDL